MAYRPPFIFDCRFEGAAEQIVQQRYQAFINATLSASQALEETGELSIRLNASADHVWKALNSIRGMPEKRALVKLKQYRYEFVRIVSQETGREVSGDLIRRMGIGDQIVLIWLLQSIAADVGDTDILVVYDPLYPGSRAVMGMSGLHTMPLAPDQVIPYACYDEAATLVSVHRHMLEHPIADDIPCYYGEQCGNPAAQVLWNWGWETLPIPHYTGGGSLYTKEKHRQAAAEWQKRFPKYFACQPLEGTRLNHYSTPLAYSMVIQELQPKVVLWGAASTEMSALKRFVDEAALPGDIQSVFVSESLETWREIIAGARHFLTGNTSGMWLGFASNVQMTVFSRSDSQHGTMWNVKKDWFPAERGKRIRILA